MTAIHQEQAFQRAIVDHLTAHGWRLGHSHDYRADVAFDTGELFAFIGATQAGEWDELLSLYGGDANATQRGFVQRLDQAIAHEGVIDVLRNGVKDRGVRIRVAYFRPQYVDSADTLVAYAANRLTVVPELAYAAKERDHGNRLDLALLLNGIPIATVELKNPLTGQGVELAKEQYRTQRDPSEPIFARRSVANFAVDPDLVFVAPRLDRDTTVFLPFNTGSEGPGRPGGQGNPPASEPGRYPTSYLWEEVWQRDNWLDLLHRFVHLRREKGRRGRTTVVFPRFHQWHAVRRLADHAATHGAGHHYLVMASAGSGKSNTIAWLGHRLASLYTPADPTMLDPEARANGLRPGAPVFDKVVIITDRRNLDAQLRETVGSFEQTAGLVVRVDERHGAKSGQLAAALSQVSGKIITVTLHTFPALVELLRRTRTGVAGSRFAIVVDEAHSSQSGEAAAAVRAVLRDLGLDADDGDGGATTAPLGLDAVGSDVDAGLRAVARSRQRSPNLSYFAFTATPKSKTLELFGTPDAETGRYRPFHTYSMRQAIEEGFILDPLRNYVTYSTYWKLVNKNPDDRDVDPAKANPLLARFAVTHPSTVAQHAEIIVEHFRTTTASRIGGRAKAMVVTASRHASVQMSRAIKAYVEERGYTGLGVLVAFSGTLDYDGDETTEVAENGHEISESALRKAFSYTRADDQAIRDGGTGRREYRLLVVAEKYQTGFDEPLLTAMYVNKTLTGVAAVQTLSRVNRTRHGKHADDLAVLDFVNDAETIRDAFRPYFEEAATLPSDPNLLYTAERDVLAAGVVVVAEMREFARAHLAAQQRAAGNAARWTRLHAELYRHLAPAVERFAALADSDDEDDRDTAEAFRADLGDFVRKYGFLSQIVPYADADLERLNLYGRHLLNRLPRRRDGAIDIGQVDLSHLRVERTGEHDLTLAAEGQAELPGFADAAGAAAEPALSPLSELIEGFNTRHGTEFTEHDLIRPFTEAVADPKVRLAAVANTVDGFGEVFDKVFEDKMMDHFDNVADLGKRYFSPEPEFRRSLDRTARSAAWRLIRQQNGLVDDAVA